MKIDNEKLIALIAEMSHEVMGKYLKSEQPIGIVEDGKIITIAVYSESEAIENGFDTDDVESLIEFGGAE